MEVFYEYFYEIQGYSIGMAITTMILRPYILHRLDRRRNTQRYSLQSPFWLRIKGRLNKTKIGKLNLRTHIMWENFRNKYADKILFYNLAKLNFWFFKNAFMAISLGLFIGFWFGESFEGFRHESPYLTRLACLTFSDKSAMYLNEVKNPLYTNFILDWDLKNKIHAGTFEVLDCIQYGKLMTSVLQDEIAYQCYYMAHLKDHQNIKTNTEMPMDKINILKE